MKGKDGYTDCHAKKGNTKIKHNFIDKEKQTKNHKKVKYAVPKQWAIRYKITVRFLIRKKVKGSQRETSKCLIFKITN